VASNGWRRNVAGKSGRSPRGAAQVPTGKKKNIISYPSP